MTIGLCPECNRINPMPTLDGMVASTCEICTMDVVEVEEKYGKNTALFKSFRNDLEYFQDRLTSDAIKHMIETGGDLNLYNFLVSAYKVEDRVVITLAYFFRTQYFTIYDFNVSFNKKRNSAYDRITHKLKVYEPQIVVKALLSSYDKSVKANFQHQEEVQQLHKQRNKALDALLDLPWYKRIFIHYILKAFSYAWSYNEADGQADDGCNEHPR